MTSAPTWPGRESAITTTTQELFLGEVSVTVWPKILKAICAKKNVFVLE